MALADGWLEWLKTGYFKTEDLRAGGLVWPKGAKGLFGDPLGPVMHAHDGASEVFYFLEGRCRFEVGNLAYEVGPGDFVYVPPEVPHNLWNIGDGDMWVFFTVGPNVVGNKWRTTGFGMEGWDDRVKIVRNPGPATVLPGDELVGSHVRRVSGKETLTRSGSDSVYLVLSGSVRARVGKLEGELGERDYIVVPMGVAHSLSATDAAVLEIVTPGSRS